MIVELGDGALSTAPAVGFFRVEFGLRQRRVSESGHDVLRRHPGVGKFPPERLAQSVRLTVKR